MGYYTTFMGTFEVEPAFTKEQARNLRRFFSMRHNEDGYPSPWCDFGISDDMKHIFPLSGKTYQFTGWLEYIKERYLDCWGKTLSGNVLWRGENLGDAGDVRIINNKINTTWLWYDMDEILSRFPRTDSASPIKTLDFVRDWEEMRRFDVRITLNKSLSSEHEKWLQDYCNTVHFARKKVDEGIYGKDGELFADPMDVQAFDEGGKQCFFRCSAKELRNECFYDEYMMEHPRVITDRTLPALRSHAAGSCPDHFCQWTAKDGKLAFNGGYCFSRPLEWLRFLIERFFAPNGYVLNGKIRWGTVNDFYDCGTIYVTDNKADAYVLPFLKQTGEEFVNKDGAY